MPHEQYSDATSNPVEQDLVSGLRNGDTKSFERLVRQYGARMLNVANHIVRTRVLWLMPLDVRTDPGLQEVR